MASLKKFKGATVPLKMTLEAGDEELDINVIYRVHVFDAQFEQGVIDLNKELKDKQENEESDIGIFRNMAYSFLAVIAKWDLKEDENDPEPIALTEEALIASGVTRELMDGILAKVREDRLPKEEIVNISSKRSKTGTRS